MFMSDVSAQGATILKDMAGHAGGSGTCASVRGVGRHEA